MTTINTTQSNYNPATKQGETKVVMIHKATHARPHGRPRNVGRKLKVRRIA